DPPRSPFGGANVIIISVVLGFPLTFAIWRVLPGRKVNAFYLRTFRSDVDTARIRTALVATLGREFRLSGIRDPRRRSIKFLRYLAGLLFALRYATPKYLNLEAGADWKQRLWRSLGDARCAVIDVSRLTTFVVEEIHLAYHCLGLDRVLFIGDTTKDARDWREEVSRVLEGAADADRIQVLIWDPSATGRQAFAAGVREFAAKLPADPPGLRRGAFPHAQPAAGSDEPRGAWGGWVWVELLVGMGVGWMLLNVLSFVLVRSGLVGFPGVGVFLLGYALVTFW